MIELIRMVEKHNTLITINYLALGFMNRSASMMTARSAHEDFAYRYAPHYFYQQGWDHDDKGERERREGGGWSQGA